MHRPVVFVGPRGVDVDPLDGQLHLPRRHGRIAGTHGNPAAELFGARGQVFREVVQHLGPVVRRAAPPAGRLVGRFHRVANVLTVPLPHLPNLEPGYIRHGQAVAGIRPHLLTADVELGGAVNRGDGRTG